MKASANCRTLSFFFAHLTAHEPISFRAARSSSLSHAGPLRITGHLCDLEFQQLKSVFYIVNIPLKQAGIGISPIRRENQFLFRGTFFFKIRMTYNPLKLFSILNLLRKPILFYKLLKPVTSFSSLSTACITIRCNNMPE